MAKYSSFKYGDGTKYGIVVIVEAIIELLASRRSLSLEAPRRGLGLVALRRILGLDSEDRS